LSHSIQWIHQLPGFDSALASHSSASAPCARVHLGSLDHAVQDRAFAGTIHVDVNPLVVAAALGKQVDAIGRHACCEKVRNRDRRGGQRGEGVVKGLGHQVVF
jgi:hypothetical protein